MSRTQARRYFRAALVMGAGLLSLSACAHSHVETVGTYRPPSAPFHGGLVLTESDLASESERRYGLASAREGTDHAPYSAPFHGGLSLPPDSGRSTARVAERDTEADGSGALHATYSAPFHGGAPPVPGTFAQPTQVTVSFASDSAALNARSQRALDQIASSLQQRDIDRATVLEDGGEQGESSRALQRERLRAVREYLRRHGVSQQVVDIQARAPLRE